MQITSQRRQGGVLHTVIPQMGWQSSWGQHGIHLGPVGPRWTPCWPHEPCYEGRFVTQSVRSDWFRLKNPQHPCDMLEHN